jgi:ribose-phosphate pyrophosphokinase
MDPTIRLFSGTEGRPLAEKVAGELGCPVGRSRTIVFGEGNLFVKIEENVRNGSVFLIQGVSPPPNDNLMELAFWIDAFKRASAHEVTAIVPFFSYGKGDKKDEPRVSIRARVCADLLEAAGVDRLVTVDLHSPQIQGFFRVSVDVLYALPVFADQIRRDGTDNIIVVSNDLGFSEQARKFATVLGCDIAICDKRRTNDTEQAEFAGLYGDVRGRDAIIVDDIIFTGGTLIESCSALLKAGARSVRACVTHGLFTKDARARLDASHLERIYVTDSVPRAEQLAGGKVHVLTIAPLLAEAIRSIAEGRSISRLFPV